MEDSYNREIDYVRIAVTDRCNLRCFYCMPLQGIEYEPKENLLSYEEIIRLLIILSDIGFKKVRFTGGEPFVRKDFISLLEKVSKLNLYDSIHITSNGTMLSKHIPKLKELGVNKINLSLDSLSPERFEKITRRNDFEKVIKTLYRLLDEGFTVKINAVVMNGINTEDIIPLTELTKENNIDLRFIEEMPFNGGSKKNIKIFNARDIEKTLRENYSISKDVISNHGETSTNYIIPGFKGKVGIIPAFSRTFCNTCNRLRITAKGEIKTCLYDNGVFSIRELIRSGSSNKEIKAKFIELIKFKPENGFEAEKNIKNKSFRKESMSSIGG